MAATTAGRRRTGAGRTRRPAPAEPAMSIATGRRLVEVAIELVEKLYVHLPPKRSMYAVNPLQRLRLLLRRLELAQPPSAAVPMSERAFYNEMLAIFAQMRDLHTSFVLPEPFRSSTAYLPFRLETCVEAGQRLYVVSQVMPEAEIPEGFARGVVVTHWNGVPIDRAVAANAEREPGSNAAARHAQGLTSLTIRWLGQSLPPDEDWVDVRFVTDPGSNGTPRDGRFVWHVFRQQATTQHEVARARGTRNRFLGMDTRGEVERQVRTFLFGGGPRRGPSSRQFGSGETVRSQSPDVFPSARDVITSHGTFAYIRIATFNVPDDDAFLREFIRLAGQLSQNGLILDVRGNGGGLIHAGERLLQVLTPRSIDACRFHFLNSARTERLTRMHAFVRAWNGSIAQAVETGAEYSQGLPLLPPAHYNDIGQRYQGPVVLVTDALCYSTTDIFAAGFQDHRIGVILGVDEATGAGGANVWEYPLIASLAADRKHLPTRLPRDASFRFAVRRVTRVGDHAGLPLEDFGVRPDALHVFTRRDVLDRNVDLIEHAAGILADRPRQRLVAAPLGRTRVRVECDNVDCVDAFLDGRPLGSTRVRAKTFTLALPRRRPSSPAPELLLNGFRQRDLVASTRLRLPATVR